MYIAAVTFTEVKLIWLMYVSSSLTDVSGVMTKVLKTQRRQFVPPWKDTNKKISMILMT